MSRILKGLALCAAIGAVAYLATIGCCRLMLFRAQTVSLSDRLHLTPVQRQAMEPLEKEFLARKQASCGILCAKRAQLIQLLKQPNPVRAAGLQLVEEIGQEQMVLEKATLEHLLAVGQQLEPSQREQLGRLVTEQLRTACRMTACGTTPGCEVAGKKK